MQMTTCCFSGHRRLPKNRIDSIVKRLVDEVEILIRNGVTDFISGGAIGFDQIAASLIISKKQIGYPVRLIFALPCINQDKSWTEQQKIIYRNLLSEADEIIYVSNEYTKDCMLKRNHYMVDCSKYCICALLKESSGTGQTVRYSKQRGLCVINVAE